MKHLKFYATILIVTTAIFLSTVVAQQQQPAQQQSKDKKPAEEESQDEQSLKLGTQLVTAPFNVTDKTNRYINDLTKDDIELMEDNKPQKIFSFERQTDLPITIAMLIDISGSQEYTLPYEKAAGERFLRRVLRPNKDIAALVTFEHESVVVQDFTSNLQKLTRAMDGVRVSVQPPAIGGAGGTPPINGGSQVGWTAMYDSIYLASSDMLGREAGRRVIILLTDGQDTVSRVKLREAIERTWKNEIIVYSIGIGDPIHGGIDTGTLKKISAETGGRAFFPRSEEDLDKAFALIDEDLRSQYILSYEPTNEARDGSFRTIQIRVRNRKDITVRHRRGYFAQKES
jgi:VWFA-related protein